MSADRPIICVTGFLGAGKSRVASMLSPERPREVTGASDVRDAVRAGTDAGVLVLELDGLCHPGPVMDALPDEADRRIITVADGVNLIAGLKDPLTGPLIRSQISAADVVVLSRGDICDVSDARAAIAGLVEVPAISASEQAISISEILAQPRGRGAADQEAIDLSHAFTSWSYTGQAVLTAETAEAFLKNRPSGAYRVKGHVCSVSGGLDLQVFGRGRQIESVPSPGDGLITAIGPNALFSVREMDIVWSEAVMQSAYQTGSIACR